MATEPAAAVPADDAPEAQVARDLVKRGLLVAPVLVLAFGFLYGTGGAISSAYAVAIVLGNFLLSATLITSTARISPAALMGATLFGYLIRLGLIFLAVILVVDTWWFEAVPLGITLIVMHLGLLLWELKYVSASLAFPALKPTK